MPLAHAVAVSLVVVMGSAAACVEILETTGGAR